MWEEFLEKQLTIVDAILFFTPVQPRNRLRLVLDISGIIISFACKHSGHRLDIIMAPEISTSSSPPPLICVTGINQSVVREHLFKYTDSLRHYCLSLQINKTNYSRVLRTSMTSEILRRGSGSSQLFRRTHTQKLLPAKLLTPVRSVKLWNWLHEQHSHVTPGHQPYQMEHTRD